MEQTVEDYKTELVGWLKTEGFFILKSQYTRGYEAAIKEVIKHVKQS